MSRYFPGKNDINTSAAWYHKASWSLKAHPEFNGAGEKMIKNTHYVERLHYGVIDHENNSVIPNEKFLVYSQDGRVFDFVADAMSVMRLNFTAAVQKGLINTEGAAFASLKNLQSYENPKVKYDKYIGNILSAYNKNYIPNVIGTNNITSYDTYVNGFFNFIFKLGKGQPITMSRWNTSYNSSILDTGLAFRYADMPYDEDQRKINEIIDHPCYGYFKNMCMNMGFSILKNNPNILLFDILSPATEPYRTNKGLFNLETFFNNRFIKTYTIDMYYIINNINIHYNKYVMMNPRIEHINVKCGKTTVSYTELETVNYTYRKYSDLWEVEKYIQIRNSEEGLPFSEQKISQIYKKAKFLLKKLDKMSAMGYINNMFRDQVWNKDHGYHDLLKKLRGKTTSSQGGVPRGEGTPTGGGSGGSTY